LFFVKLLCSEIGQFRESGRRADVCASVYRWYFYLWHRTLLYYANNATNFTFKPRFLPSDDLNAWKFYRWVCRKVICYLSLQLQNFLSKN